MQNFLMLVHALCSFTMQSPPVPVILDTDIGDDIDDTWALAMLLGCPQVDLKLIVTSTHDTVTKAHLVAKMLEKMKRTDIPIGIGKKTSNDPIQQADWLKDYSVEKYPGKIFENGIDAMITCIKQIPGQVTLCVIGPQTNIAEALKRDPSIAEKTRVVTMAGSVYIGYDGKEGRAAEYNIRKDILAARIVFEAPWEITMAPTDVCGTLRLTGDRYKQVANSNCERAATVIENYECWTPRKHFPEDSSSILFDTVAAYLTFAEDLCHIETIKLSIDDEGQTVPSDTGRPVRCALRFTDRDAFETLLVNSLTQQINP